MLDDPYNIVETIAIAQKLEIPIRDRLVKSQRLDVAAKLAERVTWQPHPHDDGVSTGEVRIDELIRGQVFVGVPDVVGRQPCRALPINPAALGVSTNGC